ncbi:NAD(P)/FAD-dependent oxidoreductase [Oceanibaculum indicum]|uniref:Flavin-binding flavocytochrome c sulfide dehydrogenase n=1 Tax=Oceanibaculum indicum P24 TaxID=1207063 RepID=K2JU53_9PROT|nr:FAD/NAD(P)-binding oxidoreductase [Oceanibaculum indicum]EKE79018.1 flavin-binding flavocytochrome c sulfide dehydrogenase [Oceanibaculum indicum P24]
MLTRRHFLAGAAGLPATGRFSMPVIGQARPKVVIVGGGAGGASVLRRLAGLANGALDITLVEPQAVYTSCFYSNLFLGGFLPMEALRHDYAAIAKLPGVTLARDAARAVDWERRQVTLAGGAVLPYDRLVLSPGIDLDYASVPGWSREAEERMPHGWKAGQQTELLKRQIDAVPDGGLIVVIAPPNPYRCPPGPYERVSMMAHALTSTGRTRARIVILDPKDRFSKQPLFQQGWEKYYPGMIEWMPPAIHAGIGNVDPSSMTVETGFETYRNADLVNVIPRQTAGRLAIEAGLTDASLYCPVDPRTMQSRADPAVFVLGDSAIAGDMPKSAFAANSQAQMVAAVIARDLLEAGAPAAAYRNRCWSLIGPDDSVFVGGEYQPGPDRIEQTVSDISTLDDDAATRRANYEDSAGWYAGLTLELFG